MKILNAIDKVADNIVDKPSAEIGQTFADIFYHIFGYVHRRGDQKKR